MQPKVQNSTTVTLPRLEASVVGWPSGVFSQCNPNNSGATAEAGASCSSESPSPVCANNTSEQSRNAFNSSLRLFNGLAMRNYSPWQGVLAFTELEGHVWRDCTIG